MGLLHIIFSSLFLNFNVQQAEGMQAILKTCFYFVIKTASFQIINPEWY